MTRLEQAVSDLQEANAALKKHTPLETLQQNLEIAKKALVAAALDAPALSIPPKEDADTFRGDLPEAEISGEGLAFDAAVAASAVAGSLVPGDEDAAESVSGPIETIDATDEVTVEQAVSADPNGALGQNWPGPSV